ncbi:MAG: glycosyltransferase family 25 protein [Planctomycetaceae bacterium]|nr:glycosyltransferase family 25 protein [Planctomycetaceae bacterium]
MLSNIFERVYVINLSRRQERLEAFYQKVPVDWPFKQPEQYTAIDGGLVSPPDWWDGGGGAWGCYKAHLRILEDCLNNEIYSVLILEDDAVFVDGFTEKVQEFWKHLPVDWEMVYLGGQHIQENIGLPRKVNEWVYHPFNVNRCHCYGFRGRRMIEKAYKHLNNFSDWKVLHHVDHYLGELHKKMETGLYVPKEWLVAQSEGKSDICGADLQLRLFPSSEETLAPTIDRPCIAVMGNYFSGINTLAGAMKELGLFFGMDLGSANDTKLPHFFEDVYLGEICRNTYSEPWLEEKRSQSDRINHLRRWAGVQCKNMPIETPLVCGKHPMLSLMGPEIIEAWKEPKFICVERSSEECYESMKKVPWCWHPSAAKYAFRRLADAREEFFEKYQPHLLRIQYDAVKSEPERILLELCNFLQHVPSPQQLQNALLLIKETNDDLCFLHTIAEQPMQKGCAPAKAGFVNPSREKTKKKRNKR